MIIQMIVYLLDMLYYHNVFIRNIVVTVWITTNVHESICFSRLTWFGNFRSQFGHVFPCSASIWFVSEHIVLVTNVHSWHPWLCFRKQKVAFKSFFSLKLFPHIDNCGCVYLVYECLALLSNQTLTYKYHIRSHEYLVNVLSKMIYLGTFFTEITIISITMVSSNVGL